MSNHHSPQRRLTVNAAFLKDIKDDNRHLKELLDRIAPLATHQQIAANHWNEFAGLVGELRDQLAFHFSLEEAYGYFDAAIDTEPQFSSQAESLRGEHPQLFARIRDLADAVEEPTQRSDAQMADLLAQYNTFFQAFAEHEEAELQLILSALDDDLGVGD